MPYTRLLRRQCGWDRYKIRLVDMLQAVGPTKAVN